MSLNALQELLDEGVTSGVYPMAQAVVLVDGETVFEATAGGATHDTHFDLASLTKVISTTSLFMNAWASGKLGPDSKLSRFLPTAKSAEGNATIGDLLYHRSGLPAFIPYFARVMPAVPELFKADTPRATWDEVHKAVIEAVCAANLRIPPGREAVYSDLGFIQLGEILSDVFGAPLDELFDEKVAKPLGLDARFRRISSRLPAENLAPTGSVRPREPAPGQETMWAPFPAVPSNEGHVDDDNAWVLDGVAGHAGLFGTARAVAKFGHAILEQSGSPLVQLALERDRKTPGSTRAMGFDTPSPAGRDDGQSSAGRHIGNVAPGAVGHLGFTGTSLWIDRGRRLVVALLTNRVANGRGNIQIRQFRPRFHDAVCEQLKL